MNKLFFYLALAGTTVFAQDAFAQDAKSSDRKEFSANREGGKGMEKLDPTKSAQNVAKQMQKRYELTDEQTTKVEAASLKFAQDVQALREKDATASTDALRSTYSSTLKGILTDVQYTKFTTDLTESEKAPQGRDGKASHTKSEGDKTKEVNSNKEKVTPSSNVEGQKEGSRPFNVYRLLGDNPNGKQHSGDKAAKGNKPSTK